MSKKLVIKIGDIVETNKKYDGEPERDLMVVEVKNNCFINHEDTYLLETQSGKRAYYGKSWVKKQVEE